MSRFVFGYFIVFVAVLELVRGHSWLHCTDYMEKNSDYYEPHKCRGYPRAANRFLKQNKEFGAESGYDHEPTDLDPCRIRRNDYRHYDTFYPMAVYYPGQQVVLAHPMKEHGADADCTNPYIPDTGNWIYRSRRNVQDDPPLSEFQQNLVFDLGVSPLNNGLLSKTYPKPGFQNAPAFCLNQDKSLGTYSFNIPVDLQPGQYTFLWLWAFNNMDDLFSTCFEVRIAQNQLERNRLLAEKGFNNFTEPCGGMTSNPSKRGACNINQGLFTGVYGNGPGGRATAATFNAFLLTLGISIVTTFVC